MPAVQLRGTNIYAGKALEARAEALADRAATASGFARRGSWHAVSRQRTLAVFEGPRAARALGARMPAGARVVASFAQ
jgi:hypothetical protein